MRGLALRLDTPVRRRVFLVVIALIYAYLLNWSYFHTETTLFAYQGLVWNPPPVEYTLLGVVLMLFPPLLLPMKLQQPSDLAIWITYVTLYIPMCFFPYHAAWKSPEEVAQMVVLFAVAFMIYVALLKYLPSPRMRAARFPDRALFWLLLVCIGVSSFAIAQLNGFKVDLSLAETYARRLEAREAAGGGTIAGYCLAWLAGSFAPVGITFGLIRKKPVLVAAGVVGLLAIFSFSGTKSSLFTPLIMLLLYWLVRRGREHFATVLIVGASSLVILSSTLWLRFNHPELSESFTRRLIISKGVSTVYYWEEFQDKPMFMRDSIFAKMVGLPPVMAKTNRIGMNYGFGPEENYNANAWASAMGNFGYTGLFLASLLCAAVLKIVDGLARHGNFEILCICASFFAIVWGEQAAETTLLSSGVAVTLVLLYLMTGATAKQEPTVA